MPEIDNQNKKIDEIKININDKINKQMVSKSDKVKSIFDKIDFLELE